MTISAADATMPGAGARDREAHGWGGDGVRRVSSVFYTVALGLSCMVGVLHFFAPYVFGWYSYIPDAPPEIYVSIDYVNFLFSVLLTGLSLILLCLRRRAFEGVPEVLTFYAFALVVWLCRVLVAVVNPWPSSLHTWLLVGALTILGTLLVPVPCLLTRRRRRARGRRARQAPGRPCPRSGGHGRGAPTTDNYAS